MRHRVRSFRCSLTKGAEMLNPPHPRVVIGRVRARAKTSLPTLHYQGLDISASQDTTLLTESASRLLELYMNYAGESNKVMNSCNEINQSK